MRFQNFLLVLWTVSAGCVFVDPDDATILSDKGVGGADSGLDQGMGSDDGGSDDGGTDDGGTDDGGTDDGGTDEGGTDDGGTGTEDCTTAVITTHPSADARGWFHRAPFEAVLNEVDTSVEISVVSDSGDTVSGSMSPDSSGLRVIFTPNSPLEPSTAYTMGVSVCDGASGMSVAFETSELGTPLSCDPVGMSYDVMFEGLEVVGEDGDFSQLFLSGLDRTLVFTVLSKDRSTIDIASVRSEIGSGRQDYCSKSSTHLYSDWMSPGFELAPADIRLMFGGEDMTFSEVSMRGAFAPDCSYMGGLFEAVLDARIVVPELADLGFYENPEDFCDAMASYGGVCAPCSADNQPYCIPVQGTVVYAGSTGAPVSCVAENDCHPSCSDNACRDPLQGVCEW
jgi:hypothetical protein